MNRELEEILKAYDAAKQASGADEKQFRASYESKLDEVLQQHPHLSRTRLEGAIRPELARIEGRIETDRHGQIIMSPPPSARHGTYQFKIADALRDLLPEGEGITECPISTADGVRAADVAVAEQRSIVAPSRFLRDTGWYVARDANREGLVGGVSD